MARAPGPIGAEAPAKANGAFRTIGELSRETGLSQHVLRYWETRFPQLRPLTRAGNRRYYRAEDVALVKRIDRLLNREGYTIRGVQQVLATAPGEDAAAAPPATPTEPTRRDPTFQLIVAIRDGLATALAEDR